MASEVEIASAALNKIGAAGITAFDDGSTRSNLCRDLYPSVRDATLRSYPWNCANTQKALAAHADAPLFGYDYKFLLPVLPYCLRVLAIEDDPEHRIKGRYIHCNNSTITIEYTARITNPGLFDSLLKEAIEARLAAELAFPITKDKALPQTMWGLYEAKLREARTMDGQEGTTAVWESNDLITVR